MEEFQWLVHMIPYEDDNGVTNYEKISFHFPSQYVASKVAEKIHGLKFFLKTLGQPTLLGRAFESHVLNTLFKECKEDYLPVKAVFNFKKCLIPAVKKQIIFSSRALIDKPEKQTLYVPIEGDKPGIDFFMPPWVFKSQ